MANSHHFETSVSSLSSSYLAAIASNDAGRGDLYSKLDIMLEYKNTQKGWFFFQGEAGTAQGCVQGPGGPLVWQEGVSGSSMDSQKAP